MEVPMPTLVSPLAKFDKSHLSGVVLSLSQIAAVKAGCEDPEKILTPLILYIPGYGL